MNVITITFKNALSLIALSVLFFSCKQKTNFESIPVVHFSTDVEPILASNCTFSGCHFNEKPYDKTISYFNVKAGSPETSKMYSVIKTLDEKDIMPKKPYSRLTEKQIQLIYIWIGQGAKNN